MMAATEVPVTDYAPLHEAVSFLASRCDWAQEDDGAGFNKPDAPLGHLLALLPVEAWNARQARDIYERLRKYRGQLLALGIDYDDLPEPPDPSRAGLRALDTRGEDRNIGCHPQHSGFLVAMPYEAGLGGPLRAAVEGVSFCREPVAHYEVAPIRGIGKKLLDFARQHGFHFGPDVEERAWVVDEYAPNIYLQAALSGARVWTICTPRDAALGARIKRIPGVQIIQEPYLHWQIPTTPHAAAVLKLVVDEAGLILAEDAERLLLQLEMEYQDGASTAVEALGAPVALHRVEQRDNGYRIYFPYSPDEVARIKEHFYVNGRAASGFRFVGVDKQDAHWFAPDVPDVLARLVAFLDDPACPHLYASPLHLRETVAESTERATAQRALSKAADADLVVPGLIRPPYPFQRAGIAYALQAKRTFIADEMGLGKTVQAIGTIQVANAYPALIICPSGLKLNWRREWKDCVPSKSVSVLSGTKPYPIHCDVAIVNYDVIHAWADTFKATKFRTVVFDESHMIKESQSRRGKAAKDIAAGVEYRLLLSGTPLLNRPKELVHQLDVMGRLVEYGGASKFKFRFCAGHQDSYGRWDFNGASNLEELNDKMRASHFVRRTKSQVLTELPAKQRSRVLMELDNRGEYVRASNEIIRYLRDQALHDRAFYASLGGLSKQERDARMHEHAEEKAIKAARAEQLVRIEALKQLAAKGKLKAVLEWIDNFLDTGEKLVVFAIHKEILADLIKHCRGCAHLLAEDSALEREKQKARFMTDPSCQVIICSLKAAGVGHTLTAASNGLMIELGWTPGEMNQGEDRLHRIGQRESVTWYYALATNSVDEDIESLLSAKRLVVDAATEGGALEGDGGSILGDLVAALVA